MNQGKMVFSQIMQFASQDILRNIVKRYNGDYKKQEFTSWKHFLCMSFGQLTHRESMSDTMLMLSLNKKNFIFLELGSHLINRLFQEPMKLETGKYFRTLE